MKQPRIQIIDGELSMIDGSSLQAYLIEWQKKQNFPNGSQINCVQHQNLCDLIAEAQFQRELIHSV